MGFIRIIIALLALYLFFLFLVQPFLILWRELTYKWNDPRRVLGPDDVDPEPLLDIAELSYHRRLGRDRFGRMIFEGRNKRGTGYFYFDRAASEEPPTRRTQAGPESNSKPRLALGWKGFTAESSPWEVLGVNREASISQIKNAYRKMITRFHPDRFQHLSWAELVELENDTKLIHAAYSALVKP